MQVLSLWAYFCVARLRRSAALILFIIATLLVSDPTTYHTSDQGQVTNANIERRVGLPPRRYAAADPGPRFHRSILTQRSCIQSDVLRLPGCT